MRLKLCALSSAEDGAHSCIFNKMRLPAFLMLDLWYNSRLMANQKIDVGYVAELARLELSDAEKTVFQGQLEDIVKYVEKISSVDVDGVPPTMHGREIVNAFREDEVRPSMEREAALANAPRRTENEFYLPKIVEGAES